MDKVKLYDLERQELENLRAINKELFAALELILLELEDHYEDRPYHDFPKAMKKAEKIISKAAIFY